MHLLHIPHAFFCNRVYSTPNPFRILYRWMIEKSWVELLVSSLKQYWDPEGVQNLSYGSKWWVSWSFTKWDKEMANNQHTFFPRVKGTTRSSSAWRISMGAATCAMCSSLRKSMPEDAKGSRKSQSNFGILRNIWKSRHSWCDKSTYKLIPMVEYWLILLTLPWWGIYVLILLW